MRCGASWERGRDKRLAALPCHENVTTRQRTPGKHDPCQPQKKLTDGGEFSQRFAFRRARRSQVSGQAHVVSLAFKVQRPGQSVI